MKRLLALCILILVSISIFVMGGKKPDGREVVTIWHSSSGNAEKAFNYLVELFNSTNENVRINAIYQGRANDILTSVNAASLAGKGLPDIAQLDATAGLDMMYSPYLVTVEELGIDTTDILPAAYAAYESRRGHLGVPFSASGLLFYYNKDLFEKAGVDAPETLDDFIEIAPIIREKTGAYAFAGVPATYELVSFLGSQNGGTYITDNRNGHDGVSESVLFDENGTFKTFLEKWKALYDTGAVNNLTSGVTSAFYSSQTASMLASSSALTSVLENTRGLFEVCVAPLPRVNEGATGGINIGGGFLASFTSSDAVKEVIEFLISPSSQAYWAEHTGNIPVSIKALESDEWQSFIEENPIYSTAVREALASSEKVIGLWIPSAYQVYYSFQSTIADVLDGIMSIDDAVKSMADMISSNLAEYRRQNSLSF